MTVAALIATVGVATLILIWAQRPDASGWSLAATAAIVPLLIIIGGHYPTSRAWLFSTGFWLAVAVGFYVVLKALAMIGDGEGAIIAAPLAGTVVFLAGAALSFRMPLAVHRDGQRPARHYQLSSGGIWIVAALFVTFEAFGVALSRLAGGSTVLEISNATQNGGAGYLFRIPLLANAFYLIILDNAYRGRRNIGLAVVATAALLLAAIAGSSRFQIIILTLWNLYFYNRFVRPLSIVWLAILAPLLAFVVVLFGYVRNIGVGDLGVLIDALGYFRDHTSAIVELFMARLDMLPQMAKGFALYAAGQAPHLDGMSYLYALVHAIPRSVWPDKPLLTAALLTAITDPGPFADGVLFYPSIVVEALFNLGWAGIFVVGVAVGALARGFDAALNSPTLLVSTWALMSFTFPLGLFDEGFHSNYVGNIIYVTALFAVGVVLLRLTRAIIR